MKKGVGRLDGNRVREALTMTFTLGLAALISSNRSSYAATIVSVLMDGFFHRSFVPRCTVTTSGIPLVCNQPGSSPSLAMTLA